MDAVGGSVAADTKGIVVLTGNAGGLVEKMRGRA